MSPKSSQRFSYLGLDPAALKRAIDERLRYGVGKDRAAATLHDWFHSAASAVRDRLIERWLSTIRSYERSGAKRVYYLSLEFLIGRMLQNNLLKLDCSEEFRQALQGLGVQLEAVEEAESDAALGNGGLGRLAACFLDSMAALRLPGFGYGIRYEYGMFNQRIEDGQQVERPDNWLRYGNPWELPRPELLYPVQFYGRVVQAADEHGRLRHRWVETEEVMAMAYDLLIPGHGTNTVNHLRLWSAKASRDFNLKYFNEGNYIKAVEEKTASENLSRVLYPDDTTAMGRELRLQQEYFFVSAALQDIVAAFLHNHHDLRRLPEKVAIQLNDTHPAIAIPELLRLLLDNHGLDWDSAWEITRRTFSYTNHTLMPEALERWPVPMLERLLPRHMQLVYDINQDLLDRVRQRFPGDEARVQRMSLIDEHGERSVRMANLAMAGTHRVNGVSAIHTELMRKTIFADFDTLDGRQIINITNGITPRRWLNQCNPRLAALITEAIGHGWITRLDRLAEFAALADDPELQRRFAEAKAANKERLGALIGARLGIDVDPHSLFDVQIKRIHEYKRQTLNLLHVIALYNRLRKDPSAPVFPRTVIVSGKAAPGYVMAKRIIRAINDVGAVINNDPTIGGRLKVAFIPNYDVTTAADIIPAAELSQQISLAGTEASGTGNMKLALNGALTIGTRDGANIEIAEAVGEHNLFLFGLSAKEAEALKPRYRPREFVGRDPELAEAVEMLASGYFSPQEPDRYATLAHGLLEEDPFLVLADFAAYRDAQRRVEALYRDGPEWTRRAILNVASMGRFSSDRTVREYAQKVWGVKAVAHE